MKTKDPELNAVMIDHKSSTMLPVVQRANTRSIASLRENRDRGERRERRNLRVCRRCSCSVRMSLSCVREGCARRLGCHLPEPSQLVFSPRWTAGRPATTSPPAMISGMARRGGSSAARLRRRERQQPRISRAGSCRGNVRLT